ncbi:hypothetical protein MAMT_01577 [Methylacidimicrobium tartarophylax]|uniref:Uncharacterized protein n=1 Tax=Methylacidimicrobium tartarophylax TaxID=1041768 RepID=A0A5E6MC42_9BACT|nr:hypothetical protein MAMT_01577 [Methylacidimicrobium tartarophylax]
MRSIVYAYPDGLPVELVEEKDSVVLRVGSNSYGPTDIIMRISGAPLHARREPPVNAGWLVREWMRRPECTEAERALANRFLGQSPTSGQANER